MSKYTTEVRFICEQVAGFSDSQDGDNVEKIIEKSYEKIFNSSLQYIPTEHRTELPMKILRHYYTREIGFETVGLWKMKLNAKMIEIMPYYNTLYESAKLIIDPLKDVDYTVNITGDDGYVKRNDENINTSSTNNTNNTANKNGNRHNTGNGHTDGSVDQTDKFSDTPQGSIVGLQNDQYLTNANMSNQENESDSNYTDDTVYTDTENSTGINTGTGSLNGITNETNDRDYSSVKTVKGKMFGVSQAKLLKEYRETILNIDMKIINDLSDLFMLVY